jgi:gamma-D-glutamyl-L-lysine dipeptidyl-peptidase
MRWTQRSRAGLVAAALMLASCAPATPPFTIAPTPSDDTVAEPVPAFVLDSIAVIRADYAPDRRVARFDVEASRDGDGLVLVGAADEPDALARLARALDAHDLAWTDRVRRLPDPAVAAPGWALVNNSVANLRSEPRHAAELATQAPLGTPLRVMDRSGGWLLVQVPDGYLAWVDAGGVELLSAGELEAHRRTDKVIYVEATGTAWSEPRVGAEPVADLVAGAILVRVDGVPGFHRARFPDGRVAYVAEAEARRYDRWAAATTATEASLVATAMVFLGRPYLWGGTSPYGMDCSGFTKTVFLLNGLILPRDASQQVHAGALVDDLADFQALRPGDLLFFGQPATPDRPERVVHVGMWVGDGRFIHSSGRVRIGSVDPADALYDAENVQRYLRTKRILGSMIGVHRIADDALYPAGGRFRPAATAGPAVRVTDPSVFLDGPDASP